MAITTENKLSIVAPPTAFAKAGIFLADALADSITGAWFFNQFAGETDDQAGDRCSWNWAEGASNARSARKWPGGAPDFTDGYATFPNSKPLVTDLTDFETTGGCFLTLACTADSSIGAGAQDRGFVCGTYGNSQNGGFGFEFNNWATGAARVIDFAASAPTTAVTCSVVTANNDLAKWRIWFGRTGSTLKLTNKSADGSTPDPTQVTLTGGRRKGGQRWTIGGRLTTGTNYTAATTKKIAFVLRFNSVPDTDELADLVAQAEEIALQSGITPLLTTP